MTRLPFEIRALEGADGALANDLVTQAKTSASQFRGSQLLIERLDSLNLSTLDGRVAFNAGRLCGGILWSVSETDLVIEVVYVEPSSRNVGLGERLVLDAVGFAKSTGRSRVLGRALPGDRETKNVFERTGLVSQLIVVGKQID